MFYYICYPFAALVRLFYSVTGSYGVSLILFTLVIKLVLLPLQMKSKKSMVRMSRMSGKMQEIQKKYANNQMKQQEEMQKLYAEQGVNPLGGCVWSLLPMPILIALYYIIREPIVYFMNFGSKANGQAVLLAAKELIEGAGIQLTSNAVYEQIEIANIINSRFPDFVAQNSGWVSLDYHFLGMDLATIPTDAFNMLKSGISWAAIGLILIPVISGVFSLMLSKVTMKGQPQTGSAAASNKMMIWMMPVMSLWIGFTLPAALGIYWIAQSAFSVVQEAVLGKFYNTKLEDEENERQRQIEENRKKRQEEGRLLQEQRTQQTASKQTLKEKQRAAQEAKTTKKKISTSEAGRVGERPYARGRSYQESRYDSENK